MLPHSLLPRSLHTGCHSCFNYFSMSLGILELGRRVGGDCEFVCVERRKILGRFVERGLEGRGG